MTRDERIHYITYKSLSGYKMNQLINRVIDSTQLFNDFYRACSRSLNNRSIVDHINNEITRNHNYIEGTKI